jgi:hypothetical protein
VLRVPGYRSRGSRFDSRRYQIFWEVVGLERGPVSLMSKTEELLARKSGRSCLESRDYGRKDPSRWPGGILLSVKVGTNFSGKWWSLGRGLRPRSLVFLSFYPLSLSTAKLVHFVAVGTCRSTWEIFLHFWISFAFIFPFFFLLVRPKCNTRVSILPAVFWMWFECHPFFLLYWTLR